MRFHFARETTHVLNDNGADTVGFNPIQQC